MSYQPPYQQQQYSPPGAHGAVVCPFCGGMSATQFCGWCGRDTTAPRRPCANCRRMVPSHDAGCWNCGARFKSELNWKIPLIILLFLAAIAVSILIRGH